MPEEISSAVVWCVKVQLCNQDGISVFTGVDLVAWMMKNVDVEDQGRLLWKPDLSLSYVRGRSL